MRSLGGIGQSRTRLPLKSWTSLTVFHLLRGAGLGVGSVGGAIVVLSIVCPHVRIGPVWIASLQDGCVVVVVEILAVLGRVVGQRMPLGRGWLIGSMEVRFMMVFRRNGVIMTGIVAIVG